jgi:hypothetical protein
VPGYFDLTSPEDLLGKARRDLARFDADPNSDDLWNAVVTVNHVWDWADGDPSIPNADMPSRDTDETLRILQDLANGLKHFRSRPATPSTEVITTSSSLGQFVLGKSPLGAPPRVDFYVSTDRMVEGVSVSVRDLVEDAIGTWDAFFERARNSR